MQTKDRLIPLVIRVLSGDSAPNGQLLWQGDKEVTSWILGGKPGGSDADDLSVCLPAIWGNAFAISALQAWGLSVRASPKARSTAAARWADLARLAKTVASIFAAPARFCLEPPPDHH